MGADRRTRGICPDLAVNLDTLDFDHCVATLTIPTGTWSVIAALVLFSAALASPKLCEPEFAGSLAQRPVLV
jgi:hypothetical protein